jgi:hypothetical protein
MQTTELLPPKSELVSAKLKQVNAAGPTLPIGNDLAPATWMASPSKGERMKLKNLWAAPVVLVISLL